MQHALNQSSVRLSAALVAAALFHAGFILGVRFDPSPAELLTVRPLRITLVQAPNRVQPENPTREASADHTGGGEVTKQESHISAPADPKPVTDPISEPAEAPKTENVVKRSRREPETVALKPDPAPPSMELKQPKPKAEIQVQSKPKLNASDLMRQAREIAQVSASRDLSNSAERDRVGRGPSTQFSVREAYIEAWVQKVQAWGTRNFPEDARKKGLTGSLTLRVTLRRDGEIAEILLLRSSGHPILDQAARRIVELAAPYAPFPESLQAEEGEYLTIRRTWQFLQGNRLQSQ